MKRNGHNKIATPDDPISLDNWLGDDSCIDVRTHNGRQT